MKAFTCLLMACSVATADPLFELESERRAVITDNIGRADIRLLVSREENVKKNNADIATTASMTIYHKPVFEHKGMQAVKLAKFSVFDCEKKIAAAFGFRFLTADDQLIFEPNPDDNRIDFGEPKPGSLFEAEAGFACKTRITKKEQTNDISRTRTN